MLFSDGTVVGSTDAAFKVAVLSPSQPLTLHPFTLHPLQSRWNGFWLYFLDWCVNVHLSLDDFSLMTHASLTGSSDSHMLSQIWFAAFVLNTVPLLYLVPSVAWGEDGIDDLHVVGYVYKELLVCTANFTYIYAMSLSTLYSLCLLYTQIQHRKYLYQGVL